MKLHIKTIDKVAIIALLVILLTNQWAIGYIDYALEVFITQLIQKGMFVNATATGVLFVVFLIKYKQANSLHIPSKTAKTKRAGKYLES